MNDMDGLYQVTTSRFCAAFVLENGKVVACAPILRKWIGLIEKLSNSSEIGKQLTRALTAQTGADIRSIGRIT